MHRSLAILAILLAACSNGGSNNTPPAEAVTEPKVSAALQGAGRCVQGTCTMHFASIAHGDTTSLTSARCADPSCPIKRARLTSAGQRKVREIAEALAPLKLEEAYGCAGCADGPIYEVVVHRPDGTRSEVTVDPFDVDSLPEPLRAASAWMDAVTDAIGACTSNEWVDVATDCAQHEGGPPTGRP